jgi:hypothetical protein
VSAAVFGLFALLSLGAGLVAIVATAPRGARALAWFAIGVAGALLPYQAPAAALVAAAALGGAALCVAVARGDGEGGSGPVPVARVAWSRRIAVFAALAGLAFVLVGTWARQFVWTGRPLPPGSGFGEGPALAGALGGAPGLLAVGLALVVVAAACAGPPRHRL